MQDMLDWVQIIQNSIASALNDQILDEPMSSAESSSNNGGGGNSSGSSNAQDEQEERERLGELETIPGNLVCADCTNEHPEWASINLGVMLCIECSGIHRSLGVHISKVRSANLDRWSDEQMAIMGELGNERVNQILENNLGDTIKPDGNEGRKQKEVFIKAKYVEKKFAGIPEVEEMPSEEENYANLFESAQNNDVLRLIQCLALKADLSWQNAEANGQSALHVAVLNNSNMVVEVLLQNRANPNVSDLDGNTPLHCAAMVNNEAACRLILSMRGDGELRNNAGDTALETAAANGLDTLTEGCVEQQLLEWKLNRIQRMAKDSELGYYSETFDKAGIVAKKDAQEMEKEDQEREVQSIEGGKMLSPNDGKKESQGRSLSAKLRGFYHSRDDDSESSDDDKGKNKEKDGGEKKSRFGFHLKK